MRKSLLWAAALLAVACTAKPEPALLDESKFVTEVDGNPVSLVTIKGGNLALQATNFGGRVVSLFVPDKNGDYKDVVLGHETIDEYVHYTKERFLGACVGPVANRITNASFTIEGVTYNLITGYTRLSLLNTESYYGAYAMGSVDSIYCFI